MLSLDNLRSYVLLALYLKAIQWRWAICAFSKTTTCHQQVIECLRAAWRSIWPREMVPPFTCRVHEMRPNLEIQQRHDPGGDWRPPRPKGSNHISRVGDWLLHGGQSITRMDDTPSAIGLLPDNMQEFRTFSMYFSDGSFYIVPYDATVHSVGNGSQKEEDEEGERRPSGWSDGDQSEAQEYADWSPLSFSVLGNDQTSFATIGGQTTRLHVQHPSQDPWVNELLPDRYHSLNLTREPNRGGIVGFFPILIGLVAFSVEPDQVTTALSHCISGDKWRLHGQRRGAGRTDRRGLVIETYTYTPDARSTPAELRAFENGQCGSKPYS